jgi:Mrp family chromosome partitioning ATPase
MGTEVIIVDGNLKNPQLHTVFQVPQVPGLLDLLESANSTDRIGRCSGYAGLRVLPLGKSSDLGRLEPGAAYGLFKSLVADFELVLFDLPSPHLCPEAASWCAWVDRVVLVIAHGQANSAQASRAGLELRRRGIELSGVVVNRMTEN